MASPIVGPQFIQQAPVPVWRQGVGWASEYALEGTRANVDAAASSYAGATGVVEIRYQEIGGDLWRATVVFAGRTKEEAQNPPAPDDLVQESWAFPRNDLQRDLWNHPRVEAQLVKMSTKYRARFKADVEAWLGGQDTISVPKVSGDGTDEITLSLEELVRVAVAFGAVSTEITAFLTVLSEGQQFYVESRRVLRWTRTGPTKGQWLRANSNTNRVMTKARVIREAAPPDWVQLKMPDGYWLKHVPEEEQTNERLQMTQEWEYFGLRFSSFAYGEALT